MSRSGGQDSCAGTGKTGFDIWLYHAGAGWWLDEFEVTTIEQATAILGRKIGIRNTVAGAIVPAGQPLGLFFQRQPQGAVVDAGMR